jgi:8-oxo-dGTP diphosphatase
VDCIIFGFDGSNLQVLIGKRQMDPGRGEWSLYGGFVIKLRHGLLLSLC